MAGRRAAVEPGAASAAAGRARPRLRPAGRAELAAVSPRAAALAIFGLEDATAASPAATGNPRAEDALLAPAPDPGAVREEALRLVDLPRADGLIGFQVDAVERAESILAQRGGVLIADGVGMGKTRVGAALATNAIRAGGRVLLVVPAGLRRHWRVELRRRGDGSAARCEVASHTMLSRDADPEAGGPPFGRIIVDEAHAFRNARTRRYGALARLARHAEVVLLTATPINNSVLDLYFQLRLFAGDGAFADLGVPDLARLFRLAALAPDAPPGPALAAVLGAVLIRRPRSAAAGLAGRGLRFPERAAPAVVRYDLNGVYRDGLDEAVAAIERLRLAPYRLAAYGGAGARAGAAELLRLLLAKRLESSVAAFRASVTLLVEQLAAFGDALERGLLRRPSDRPGGAGVSSDQLVFEELLLARVPAGVDVRRLREDTRADVALLGALLGRLPGGGAAERTARTVPAQPAANAMRDPKVEALRELLLDRLAGEKVLVFTEFRDTALDLWRTLREAGGVALIYGGHAYLGAAPAGRAEVVRRFAPWANDVREPPPREAVRILIATDVLSEGLNLQDAAHVVSFDLPWNPVRLIQRIGRVDRLGSVHAIVHAHHFLPDAGLDRLLGLVDRLRRKLAAIRGGLVGTEDALAAGAAADPDTRGLIERLAVGDPSLLDALEAADTAAFSGPDPVRRLRVELARALAAASPAAAAAPVAAAVLTTASAGRGPAGRRRPERDPTAPLAVVGVQDRHGTAVLEVWRAGIRPAGASAAALLRRALDDNGRAEMPAAALRTAGAAVHAVRLRIGEGGCRSRPDARSAAATAIRRLRAAVAALPDAPEGPLCARVDRLTAALASGFRTGQEAGLRHLFDRWRWDGSADPTALCDRLERFLRSCGRGSDDDEPPASVVGVLVIEQRRRS